MSATLQPLFLDLGTAAAARRFATYHVPRDGVVRALAVYVHPFAEEMNKSRRMAARQARQLASHGFAVLQPDLFGCGDSAGEFGDATWSQWVDDVVLAAAWLRDRHRAAETASGAPLPLWLWGLRAGALLATAAAPRIDGPRHFLLWQPSSSGKAVLQQFLRLKAASELLAGQAKGAIEQLRAELQDGRPVEVAGYTLHPQLCSGLEQAVLAPPPGAGRLEWMELQPRAEGTLSPIAGNAAAAWQSAGWHARAQVVAGPAFWQTVEIEDAPALLDATRAALCTPTEGALPERRSPSADLVDA